MAEEITSPLVKSGILTYNSTYFPQYVLAAAQREGVVFDTDLVSRVAADPEVVDAVKIYEDGSVDGWLRNSGGLLDDLLLDAVARHGEVN